MHKTFIVAGAINGLLAVALGAFAAHALKTRLPESMLTVFQTSVHYHATHALALLFTGIIAQNLPDSKTLLRAGWAFQAGIVLFCGSLYLLALTGLSWLGAVTPFGGSAFLLGWGLLAWATWRGL